MQLSEQLRFLASEAQLASPAPDTGFPLVSEAPCEFLGRARLKIPEGRRFRSQAGGSSHGSLTVITGTYEDMRQKSCKVIWDVFALRAPPQALLAAALGHCATCFSKCFGSTKSISLKLNMRSVQVGHGLEPKLPKSSLEQNSAGRELTMSAWKPAGRLRSDRVQVSSRAQRSLFPWRRGRYTSSHDRGRSAGYCSGPSRPATGRTFASQTDGRVFRGDVMSGGLGPNKGSLKRPRHEPPPTFRSRC